MEKENQIPQTDPFEREENCRKALKTVSKAVFMRLFVTAILIFAVAKNSLDAWVMGLMIFVMIINLTGILPLLTEWKRLRSELRQILAEEDAA